MANINIEVVSTPPSYVTGERRKTPHACARHASLARDGAKSTGTRHLREWSAEIRPPPPAGARLTFAVFIFGDLGSKSARYGNLNPKRNRFRSLTRREVGLTSQYI
jgi:hypothetical protein